MILPRKPSSAKAISYHNHRALIPGSFYPYGFWRPDGSFSVLLRSGSGGCCGAESVGEVSVRMEITMMAHELDKTDMRRVICEAGRCAVLKGREIWGGPNDNDMREDFLSALIAVELHEALGKPVRVELEYTAIYRAFFDRVPEEIISAAGSLRADIVIGAMEDKKFVPTRVIEIKKFAEGGSVESIVADLKKSDPLMLDPPFATFAGVLASLRNFEES